jgi:CRISPR-associated protein Cmr6
MAVVSDVAQKVPMMFRAQVNGRCQLQRLIPRQEPDAIRWAEEWVEKIYPQAPTFASSTSAPQLQNRSYQINWRFVSNGGQDDGVIRPVIGAKGWPYYPGSSMKGLFRRACTPAQADLYCGKALSKGDFEPGILRFLGGYPTDDHWTESLVDIVHPQQAWQVKDDQKDGGAFVQISLYKPELSFGISSSIPLEDSEWLTIWQIWEQALAQGIGCRVSAGYGHPQTLSGRVLFRGHLKGQGQAAKLLDQTGEFRPNIFRAAIRGHALRIFGGLVNAETADRLVNELFGSAIGGGDVGLLNMSFQDSKLDMGEFGSGGYVQPTYAVEGQLLWLVSRPLADPKQEEALKQLIAALTRFAMLLGGFGKSWRRVDHRLFFEDYYDDAHKSLIGCHWQWLERSWLKDIPVRKLDHIGAYIDRVRQTATQWMQLRGVTPQANGAHVWREAWHPDQVQVWGRLAASDQESEAVRWFHGAYQEAIPAARVPKGSIYDSSLTGKVSQVGRIWHRMYPLVRLVKNSQDPTGKPLPRKTEQYFELLTIFPDNSPESTQFLTFLATHPFQFQKLWPCPGTLVRNHPL